MVEPTDIVVVKASLSELFQMVDGLICLTCKYIETNAPEVLITKTISRAKKFNETLKSAGYDHREEELFDELASMCKNKGAKDE